MYEIKFSNGKVLSLEVIKTKGGKDQLAFTFGTGTRPVAGVGVPLTVDLASFKGFQLLKDSKVIGKGTLTLGTTTGKVYKDRKFTGVIDASKVHPQVTGECAISEGDFGTLNVRISQPRTATANVSVLSVRPSAGRVRSDASL